jgi:hypothetical protein
VAETQPITGALSVCPECGSDGSGQDAQGRGFGRRRLLVLLWVLILLIATGVLLGRHTKTWQFTYGSGGARLVGTGLSLENIRQIAAGESVQGAKDLPTLVLQATPRQPDIADTWALDVGFVPAPSEVREEWSLGWPTVWAKRSRFFVYQDGLARSGLRSAVTDPTLPVTQGYEIPRDRLAIPVLPRWRWRGRELVYQAPPKETGGVFAITALRLPAMAVPGAMIVLAWVAMTLLIWGLERRGRDPRGMRVARPIVACIILLAFISIALASIKREETTWLNTKLRQVGYPPGPVYFAREGYARIRMNRAEVERLSESPNGARTLAAEILRVAPIPSRVAENSVYLAAGADPAAMLDEPRSRHTLISEGFPVMSFNREYFQRRPDFGVVEPVPHPPGIRLLGLDSFWYLVIPSADPSRPTIRLGVSPDTLGMIVLGICGLTMAAWYPLVGFQRHQIRKRRARGECPSCGYELVARRQA